MGLSYFMEAVGADYVFPMHMWEEYSYIERYLANEGKAYADHIVKITKQGQVFVFDTHAAICVVQKGKSNRL